MGAVWRFNGVANATATAAPHATVDSLSVHPRTNVPYMIMITFYTHCDRSTVSTKRHADRIGVYWLDVRCVFR